MPIKKRCLQTKNTRKGKVDPWGEVRTTTDMGL